MTTRVAVTDKAAAAVNGTAAKGETLPQPTQQRGVRLAKYLAGCGIASRREACRLIEAGRIAINGQIAQHTHRVTTVDGAVTLDGQPCTLTLDGHPIALPEAKSYWLLNKAVGTDCRLLPQDPASLIHLLPKTPRLFPVGRLDKDSRGLLLLTNDGELSQRLMHPDHGHEKTYEVRLDRHFDDVFLHAMAQGVDYQVADKTLTTRPCDIERTGDDSFCIVLTQGLNRQIRRMSAALGYKVIDLKRTELMTLTLGSLNEGEMRSLRAGEIAKLFASLDVPGMHE